MSDTPRTDDENMELYDGHSYLARTVEAVPVEFARKLERELEAETKRRLGAEACLKSWKEDDGADAARLDWLVQFGHKGLVDLADQNIFITRESIDKAMEAQNDEA